MLLKWTLNQTRQDCVLQCLPSGLRDPCHPEQFRAATLKLWGLFAKRKCESCLCVTSPPPSTAVSVLYIWGKTGKIRVWEFSSPFSAIRENKKAAAHLSSARPRHLKWLPSQLTLGEALMACFPAERQQNRYVSFFPKSLPPVPAQLSATQTDTAQAINEKSQLEVTDF